MRLVSNEKLPDAVLPASRGSSGEPVKVKSTMIRAAGAGAAKASEPKARASTRRFTIPTPRWKPCRPWLEPSGEGESVDPHTGGVKCPTVTTDRASLCVPGRGVDPRGSGIRVGFPGWHLGLARTVGNTVHWVHPSPRRQHRRSTPWANPNRAALLACVDPMCPLPQSRLQSQPWQEPGSALPELRKCSGIP